jgi:hypothetical protein
MSKAQAVAQHLPYLRRYAPALTGSQTSGDAYVAATLEALVKENRNTVDKADKRTRSKWSRVMRYAAVYKSDSETVDQFIRRKGGINACAARFARWVGRGRVTRSERRSTGG